MPQYRMMVTYDITASCEFVVEAKSKDEAVMIALDQARDGAGDFHPDWDGMGKPQYYIGDPDGVELVEPESAPRPLLD